MKFSDRELEVIGHALKTLHEQVNEIDPNYEFEDYLIEINDIQTRITDNMPRETLN
tara:strand:- start:110 stop:277 length:168 start_codon:yes stop_codon:yes gene_type:complete